VSTQPSFDAAEWLAKNTIGGRHLTPEASKAVADFTMMWNLFEGDACANTASVREFERLAASSNAENLPADVIQSLEDCIAFWMFRYRTPDGFSERFVGLNFRTNDRRDHVERVLLGERTSLQDKILALAVIVYRLRNNLFHGLKTLDMLNDQVSNLNTASRCLGTLMTLKRSHLVRPPPPAEAQVHKGRSAAARK